MSKRNFKRLLIHRCTLVHPGQKIGEDDYGQDIISDVVDSNVACRVDRIREEVSNSDTGPDYILSYILYLPNEAVASLDMEIRDIFDKDGRSVLPGTYRPLNLNPIYDSDSLHHFEVSLQRS